MDKKNEKVAEQSIALHEGQNIIILLEGQSMHRMAFCLRDETGSVFSVDSMQLRTTINGFFCWAIPQGMGSSFCCWDAGTGRYFLLAEEIS